MTIDPKGQKMNVIELDTKLATTSSSMTHYTITVLIWYFGDVLPGKKLKASWMIITLEHVATTYLAYPPHKKSFGQDTFGPQSLKIAFRPSKSVTLAKFSLEKHTHLPLHCIPSSSSVYLQNGA